MSDPNTLRILEIDGGGARGYLPLVWLQRFIELWGINQNELWKYFDVICGTSIGGIQAIGYAAGLGPNDLSSFFTDTSQNVFTLYTGIGPIIRSQKPNAFYKATILVPLGIPFYNSSGGSASLYGSGLLKATMLNTLVYPLGSGSSGTPITMQQLKTNVIIPGFDNYNSRYVNFSNLDIPDFIGRTELAANCAIATGAAPVYLPPLFFPIGSPLNNPTDTTYGFIDGGVYNNNPSQFGLTLGKMLKKNVNRYCVLSLGTGLAEYGFDNNGVPPPPPPEFAHQFSHLLQTDPLIMKKYEAIYKYMEISDFQLNGKVSNLKGNMFNSLGTIFALFGIASTGAQESVAQSLYLESTYGSGQLYYYRFQPKLATTYPDGSHLDTELDSTTDNVFAYLAGLANTSFDNDISNISTFLAHLTL